MRIEKCYFCSGSIYPGHGIQFIRNDSKVFKFCRSKCHKHFKAKHNPRKFKWTKAFRKIHGKEMIKDATLEFEQKRNEPLRYNREIYQQTVQVMKKVGSIRKQREERFKQIRTKAAMRKQKNDLQAELEKHVTLISEPTLKKEIETKKFQKEEEQIKEKEKQVLLNKQKSKSKQMDMETE